jgi:hypothetical protein
VIAGALVATKSSDRGMIWPLALLGLFEVIIGVGLWARTDAQVAAPIDQLARAPTDMARAELGRMGPVMRNFKIVKAVEILVLPGGIVLSFTARRSNTAFAVGIGCIAQAALLLVFDLFAERRAERYVEALRRPRPDGRSRASWFESKGAVFRLSNPLVPVDGDPSPRSLRFNEFQLGWDRPVGEQTLAAAQQDREDPEAILVDEIVLHQRLNEVPLPMT